MRQKVRKSEKFRSNLFLLVEGFKLRPVGNNLSQTLPSGPWLGHRQRLQNGQHKNEKYYFLQSRQNVQHLKLKEICHKLKNMVEHSKKCVNN